MYNIWKCHKEVGSDWYYITTRNIEVIKWLKHEECKLVKKITVINFGASVIYRIHPKYYTQLMLTFEKNHV